MLRELPPDVKIGLGLRRRRFPEIDTPEQIVERSRRRSSTSRPTDHAQPRLWLRTGQGPRDPARRGLSEAEERSAAARALREKHG